MGHRDLSDKHIYHGITTHGYTYALAASSTYLVIKILGIRFFCLGISSSGTEYRKSGMDNSYLLKYRIVSQQVHIYCTLNAHVEKGNNIVLS